MHLSRRAATLTDSQSSGNEADLAAINLLSQTRLEWEDVYVRSMYLCSDQPCESDWSRFAPRALEQIGRLVVGQSVITGHDRKSLPLARFFKADVIERNDPKTGVPSLWVQAWFYWLRETSGAADLLLNIDGGIYREVSIAWRYRHWQCSICGQEDGVCTHRPGEIVGTARCLRVIDDIVDVLEGSLVYKGADGGATLAGSRAMAALAEEEPLLCIWPDNSALFQLLVEHDFITDAAEVTSETFDSLCESVPAMWVDNFQEMVHSGLNPHQLLAPGGHLLTRDPNGSIEAHLNTISGISVERSDSEEGIPILVAQRSE
ncbi:MAG: hypothetical protein ABIH23_24305 [bacterium]